MTRVFEMAVLVLSVALALIVIWCVYGVLRARAKGRSIYLRRRRERDRGRERCAVESIFDQNFRESKMRFEAFKEVWVALAVALDINAELMRPQDRVDDLMVSNGEDGPDSIDLLEFLSDMLPDGSEPHKVLSEIARDQRETVKDIVEAVIARQQNGCAHHS